MGVYIPNMKMPEKCGECRFAVDGWCYAYGKPNIDALANDGRTNFCPLVPVQPHGRLIEEADAIETAWMILRGLGYRKEENPQLEQTVHEVFATAPTIEVE